LASQLYVVTRPEGQARTRVNTLVLSDVASSCVIMLSFSKKIDLL
jgi:hypothetical protein